MYVVSATDTAPLIAIDLQQCWFLGTHSNVGGGHQDGPPWMVDRWSPFLDFNAGYLSQIFADGQRPGEAAEREGKV